MSNNFAVFAGTGPRSRAACHARARRYNEQTTNRTEPHMLPFSEACERNKGPILEVLRAHFADRSQVLEIGSGTGQHTVYFAAHLTHLTWHPTERLGFLPDLAARLLA